MFAKLELRSEEPGRACTESSEVRDRASPYDAQIHSEALAPGRLVRAKRAFTTRRIELAGGARILTGGVAPASGDLVLARIDRLGHHRRIETPEGRRSQLYVGDEVLLCYGARYASDQFEALVPDRIEPCHMVAAGGIAALCVKRHSATKPATQISPIGLVADSAGEVLNLGNFALDPAPVAPLRPYCLAVIGTSMNAGKTTTIAGLVRGMSRAGHKVAVGKVTGTGAGGDRWAYLDAGAFQVLDFTDFGFASTYKVPIPQLLDLLAGLVRSLAKSGPDIIVLELADGLYFHETDALTAEPAFRDLVDDIVVAASDAMGADAGIRRLAARALKPVALAGRITSSPLAMREAARVTDVPIVGLEEMMGGAWMPARLALPKRVPA